MNIWDRFLNDSEIALVSHQCLPQLQGNVVQWDDFKDAESIGVSFDVPGNCDGAYMLFKVDITK